jgi:ABC-2 type transport system permease protein
VTLAAVRAEWFKLVRRPATWVTIGLLLAMTVGIEYVIVYVVVAHPPPNAARSGANLAALRTALYPASLITKTLANTSSLDGVFALILGVLAQGSEYSWGTVKTVHLQLPGRVAIVFGRLLSIAGLTLVMAVGLFAADALVSYLIAVVDGAAAAWPPLLDLARGVAAAWLILSVLAVLGFGLATLFRQSAMAIGLGLAYVLLIENVVFGLLVGLGGAFKQAHEWFPIANAGYLQSSFGTVRAAAAATVVNPGVDATHAVMVLLLWLAAIAAGSAALARARDIA